MTAGTDGRGAGAAPGQVPETYSYTLTLGGRYAGTQDWVLRPDRGSVVVRVQSEFGGALPAGRRVQESRSWPHSGPGGGFSQAYAEAEGHSRRPQFETLFDERTGLVTLRQGKDEAHEPLLEPHHDPLSLLLSLRHAADTTDSQASPSSTSRRLVGGRVHVQRLPDAEVLGLGAHVYFLRPGGAYVYVERAAPHRLLRLIQPSDFGPVDALLNLAPPGSRGGHTRAETRPDRGHTDTLRPGGNQQPQGALGKPRRRKP